MRGPLPGRQRQERFKCILKRADRSNFHGIGARDPVRNAATKRAVRETRYQGMFRLVMEKRYRIFT